MVSSYTEQEALQSYLHLEPQNMTSFGNQVSADVISEDEVVLD
jgi:hypothetical protein